MPRKKEIIGDLNFEKVIEELKLLRSENPTIRIGSLLQAAVDTRKKRLNYDLNNVSSKELLSSIKEFKEMLQQKKVKKPKKRSVEDANEIFKKLHKSVV